MADSEEGDRLENLMNLSPRYVIVPLIPRMELLFFLAGSAYSWNSLTRQHSGISNCKPGIWKVEVKTIPGAGINDCPMEACIRWVADLDEDTKLDFTMTSNEWKAREQMLTDRFDNSIVEWEEGVVWKHVGSYYHYGGLLNVISSAYFTPEAVQMIMEGCDHEEWDDGSEDYEFYLARTTSMDVHLIPTENSDRNEGFTFGGLHCKF